MLGKFIHPATGKTVHTDVSSAPIEQTKSPMETKPEILAAVPTPAAREEGNKLTVGPNIKLKGSEITDCEILVVEGRVEAAMNSRDIRIAEGGVFSGKAEIDVAEIRGLFEGELTARKRLVVYSTGKVTGHIRYGALMIEEGGTLSGEVSALPKENKVAPKAQEISVQEKPEAISVESLNADRVYPSSVLGRTPLGSRRL